MDHRPSSQHSTSVLRLATLAALAATSLVAGCTGPTGAPPPASSSMAISAVSPASGPSAGGTVVAVDGSGFAAGAHLRVGGLEAAQVVVESATRITGVAPAHAAGAADVEVVDAAGHVVDRPGAFTFVDAPSLSFIEPGHVPQGGGTVVLHGQHFAAGARVLFGADASAGNAQWLAADQLVAAAAAHAPGTVDVTVENPDGQRAVLPAALTFDPDAPPPPPATLPPSLSTVAPDAGPETGGTVVALGGTDFDPAATVTFGGSPATVTASAATGLTVTAPPHATGAVDVTVRNPDGQSSTRAAAFTYVAVPAPAPAIASVAPASGPDAGGTSVVVSGTAFQAGATVTFGGAPAVVVSTTPDALTVLAPAHPAGAVAVVVTNPDGQAATLAQGYAFVAAPVLSLQSVSPASGPIAGGTSVVLAGTGFDATTTVTFGGVAAAVTAGTATSLTVTTPPHAAGVVAVAVANPGAPAVSLAAAFAYLAPPPPTLSSAAPASGPDLGGTPVTLAGSGFAAGAKVTFGGTAATVGTITGTSIAAIAPPHAAGAVDLTVTNPDGQASTLAAGYAYLPPPQLATVTPASGPAAGGTQVSLAGAGFQAGATVTFGGTAAAVVSVTSSGIVVTSPVHPAGAVDVVVTNPDGRQAALPAAFTYQAPPAPPPSISSVAPASGTTLGGTALVISGAAFDAAAATVSVGGVSATVTARTAASLSVISPAHAAGLADVVVVNGDGQSATLASAFTYVTPPPALSSLSPASGPAGGGTVVQLVGTAFQAGATVTFGGASALVGLVTPTAITATAPAHAAGAVAVSVTNPDGKAATLAAAFTYVAAPSISTVSPTSGTTLGGTAVTISGAGFDAGATVTLGGSSAAVTLRSATSLTVTSPAHAAGLVDVVVVNGDGQSAVKAAAYTFVAPPPPAPTIASVAPPSGPSAGGTSVTIGGANFQAGATVTFGGVAATVSAVTATTITASTPAHPAGLVAVAVTNPGGQGATLAAGFTYLAPPPALASLSPASGPDAGGTLVTLAGTAFQAGATVAFGGAAAVVGTVASTSITAQTPAHAAGAVDVTVTNPDGQVSTLAGAFTFVAPPPPPPVLPAPVLSSVFPTSGPAVGGTVVGLSGASFQAGATVTVGGASAAVSSVTASAITITTPAHAAGAADVTVTNPDGQAVTLPAAFTYVAAPALVSLAPATGVTTGGAAVTLTGSAFRAGATVSFGGAAAPVGTVTGTTIAVTAPAHAAGAVAVTVTNPDGQASTLAGGFTYVLPPPAIASLAPASGSTLGGAAVTVTGSGFQAGATATLGGAPAVVGAVTATSLALTTPAHAAGAVTLVVTNPDGQTATLAGAFTYVGPPSLASVSPASGLTTGGTAVTLTGSGFVAGASVTFGGAPAVVGVVTATSISLSTPSHAAGAVAVTVTNPDGQAATLAGGFTYVLPPPAIASLAPASGSTLGGTAVTVTGSGFQAGATATLGGAPAVVGAVTATSLTLTTPAHAAGAASLVVTNPDGQAATLAGAFTYVLPPPALASLTPASGPDAGGTVVTLAGSGFVAGAAVAFGGTAATVSALSATSITATTPAHLAGAVSVSVTNPDGQASTLAGAFTFVAPPPPPVLSSVLPASGSTAGGTAVSLSGASFQAGASVSFGGVAATVVSSSATAIAVTTPAHAAGAVDVTVLNPDGKSTTLPAAYTYVAPPPPPPTLSALSPVSGTTAGGTSVTLTGSAFGSTATVGFGGVAATVTARSATSLTATTPAHAAGAVDVVVTNPDGQKATLAAAFAYVAPPPPPALASLSPVSGPTAGGTQVVLSGTGFAAGATVRFGAAAATVQTLTATAITVASPAGTAGAVAVSVTNPDGQASTLAAAYTYVAPPPPPTLASVTPASGSTAGGTSVVLAGTGFASGATVTVGGAAAAVGGVTATAISITTPAHAAGAADVVVVNPDGQSATLAGAFTFVAPPPPPALASLTPVSGSTLGGTAVTLTGTGFAAGASVTFGAAAATVTAATATSLSVTTPAGAAGTVDVKVTNPDGQASTLVGAFTYVVLGPPPLISSLTPTSGFNVGGTVVTIAGSEFVTPVVTIGGLQVVPSANTKTSITFTTPAHAAGVVDVVVTNGDGQFATKVGGFTYVQVPVQPPPVITSISPASGPQSGNTLVTITGTGFTAGLTVTFGGVAGLAPVVTATSITVTTAGGPAGPVDVTVTNVDRQSSTLVGGYTYVAPPPVVNAINVRGSPQAGGGLLLFVGTGLQNTVSVTFGGVPATGLTYDPLRSSLTVTVPASPLGPTTDGFVDLVLTNLDGQSTTWPNFHYGNPPNPTGFTPDTGPKGIPLVITGTDFTADTTGLRVGLQVSFGGTFATITAKSATSITVTVPKLNPGVYQVLVTNFDSQFAISPGTFTAPGP